MASLFSRERILGHSRRDSTGSSTTTTVTSAVTTTTLDPLPSPFGDLTPSLSPTDLRETAYEIFARRHQTSVVEEVGMKKAFGMRSSSNLGSPGSGGSGVSSGGKTKKNVMTVGELIRIQMKVSEANDSRIRRALLRISAGQV